MTPDDLTELEHPTRLAKASGFTDVSINVDHLLELIAAAREHHAMRDSVAYCAKILSDPSMHNAGKGQAVHELSERLSGGMHRCERCKALAIWTERGICGACEESGELASLKSALEFLNEQRGNLDVGRRVVPVNAQNVLALAAECGWAGHE